MRAKTNLAVDYPTEFTVTIVVQDGARELVSKHLDSIPGKIRVVPPKRFPNTFYVLLEADDYNHALWRVRNHLRPVCGVVEVS